MIDVPELPDPATVDTDDAPVSPAADSGDTGNGVEDIILLGADPDIIEQATPNLASYGIMAIIDDAPMARTVKMDVGRIHYNRWLYIGGTEPDIAKAYSDVPARSTLKPGGKAWFVGAGGPMGRMHVQAAIQAENGPATIVCTDISDERLDDLCTSFSLEAKSKGIEFVCLNPMNKEDYAEEMAEFKIEGFDDIIILAPVPPVIADASTYLGTRRRDEHLRGRAARQRRRNRPERRLSQAGARHRALRLHHREYALYAGSGRNRATLAQPLRRRHRLAGSLLRRPASRRQDRLSPAKSSSTRTSNRCPSPRSPT